MFVKFQIVLTIEFSLLQETVREFQDNEFEDQDVDEEMTTLLSLSACSEVLYPDH